MIGNNFRSRFRSELKRTIKNISAYRPEKVLLFGGAALENFTEDSDLDLIVVKNTKDPFWKRQKEVINLLNTTLPVDIYVLTPKELARQSRLKTLFADQVERYGRTVYQNV